MSKRYHEKKASEKQCEPIQGTASKGKELEGFPAPKAKTDLTKTDAPGGASSKGEDQGLVHADFLHILSSSDESARESNPSYSGSETDESSSGEQLSGRRRRSIASKVQSLHRR